MKSTMNNTLHEKFYKSALLQILVYPSHLDVKTLPCLMFPLLPHVVPAQPPAVHHSVCWCHLPKHHSLQMFLSITLWFWGMSLWFLFTWNFFVSSSLCFITSVFEFSNHNPVIYFSRRRKRSCRLLALSLIILTPDIAWDGGEHLVLSSAWLPDQYW